MSRILVVAPHPDDEVFGAGGAICRHIAQGDQVFVVVVTVGCLPLFDEQAVAMVRNEAAEAWRILGISGARFLDVPAAMPEQTPNYVLNKKIADVIEDLRPDTLYLPFAGDLHIDHQRVFLGALVAARPVLGSPVRRILCYETLSETNWNAPCLAPGFNPNVFINIAEYLDTKLQAAACYKSQMKPFPNERSLEALKVLAMHRGATVGVPAAEAFMLIREIV